MARLLSHASAAATSVGGFRDFYDRKNIRSETMPRRQRYVLRASVCFVSLFFYDTPLALAPVTHRCTQYNNINKHKKIAYYHTRIHTFDVTVLEHKPQTNRSLASYSRNEEKNWLSTTTAIFDACTLRGLKSREKHLCENRVPDRENP